MGFLEVEHVSKRFPAPEGGGTFWVFQDVHFHVERGEFVTMVGHSGCGKTTLLYIMAGLETASQGGIVLDGQEIAGPGLDRMVVFQNFCLMPWMTVFQNIRLAVSQAFPDRGRARTDAWTRQWITMVGLAGEERKRPAQLSGGMRQRVGLARAFATEPKVLLLDEPFAQIDALTRSVIQEELVRMWTATRNTVFMVTHDVDEAILLSDRILLMTAGPDADLAEEVAVDIPRPRSRATVIEDPRYYTLRNHIIRFLTEHAKGPARETPGMPPAPFQPHAVSGNGDGAVPHAGPPPDRATIARRLATASPKEDAP